MVSGVGSVDWIVVLSADTLPSKSRGDLEGVSRDVRSVAGVFRD